MPTHKVKECDIQRIDGRKVISLTCEVCGISFIQRYDHYKRKIKSGKENRCQQCSRLKMEGYVHQSGYVIKHYKQYDIEYWPILKKMCKSNGQIKEHRAVMAISIGRALFSRETVHHKNGVRNDNRIENLELHSGAHGQGFMLSELIEDNKRLVAENAKLRGIILRANLKVEGD